MALKARLDRWGDRSMELATSLIRNPAPTIAAATVVLFAVVRIPTEIFYRQFGVRPEEVGLNSVQVLLQGAAVILVVSFAIGLLYGIFLVALLAWRGATKGRPRVSIREAVRTAARLAPIVVPIISVGFATVTMSAAAINSANAVEAGFTPTAKFMPWKAVRVEAQLTHASRNLALPGCESLYYLGEGDGRVTLYDSAAGQTHRLDSGEVQLSLPAVCVAGN